MPTNPWLDWLEDYPQAAYGAYQPKTGSRSFLDYWRGQQSNVYDQYMGQLGQMAKAGQAPSMNLTDYLGSYPWLQKWFEQSPQQRGERPSLFSPNVRWQL